MPREDIPELCRHFLHQIAKRENSAFRHVENEAIRAMQRYNWPGNVRELQNIIERAAVLESEPGVVRAATIEPLAAAARGERDGGGRPGRKATGGYRKAGHSQHVEPVRGHRVKTAGALGIGVRTLGMKLKRLERRRRAGRGGLLSLLAQRCARERRTCGFAEGRSHNRVAFRRLVRIEAWHGV